MQRISNFLFREILKTPPLQTNPNAGAVLYCALEDSSCRACILAIKSFLRYFSDIMVVVQNDGSLKEKHILELKSNFPGIVIYSKDEMLEMIKERSNPELFRLLPDSNMYDSVTSIKIIYLKFLNVIFRFNGRKVFIIDSDLVFLRCPHEIIQWINEPYTHDFYGEGSNEKAEDFHKMGFNFESLDIANFSSGTLGIGGEVDQSELIEIFQRIRNYDPTLFKAWEIEQALWSIILSQRKNPVNLDELKEVYIGSGWRTYKELKQKAIIAHFAGSFRFKNIRYLRFAKEIIYEFKRANFNRF
jgi:hypothetical protein